MFVIKLGSRVTPFSVFKIYYCILTLRVDGDDEGWIGVRILSFHTLYDEISVNKYVILLFAGPALCHSEKFESLVG